MTFGGDHFVSYPLIKAHAEKYGPISLLQFDAHCDTWEDDGYVIDHGTMFARAVNEGLIDINSSTQIGLRTFNDDDFGYCEACGVEIGLPRLEVRPTATLCIDCKTVEEIREKQVML